MKPKVQAFATLTAMAAMGLLVTYLTIGATHSASLELSLDRAKGLVRARAWATLDRGLKSLQESWNPTRQTFTSWSAEHSVEDLRWVSLSGRVNLNTVSPFVLALPAFGATLRGGVTVEQFVASRSLHGPTTDESLYSARVQSDAMLGWYTVHSLWNLNTADESMLEAMVAQRTQSPSLGTTLRASLRSFREQPKRIGPSDWSQVTGSFGEALVPVATLEPEVDVNEAEESLIAALVSNPAWKVSDATARVQEIVQARRVQPWTKEKLMAALGVSEDNLLIHYLGVRTRFLGGEVRTEAGTLSFVVFLSGGDSLPVAPKVIQTKWRTP